MRAGTARIRADDEPEERIRILGPGNRSRRLRLTDLGRDETDPLTLRKVLAG
jgi:hypothetical protein